MATETPENDKEQFKGPRIDEQNRDGVDLESVSMSLLKDKKSGKSGKKKRGEKRQDALHQFILDNKDYLLKVIEESGKKKKFRQSAHYVEQKLSYERPKSKNLEIFDLISPETRDKIKNEEVRYIGIRLTPPEDRLVNSISRLLEKKSFTKNWESKDFYMGNEPSRLVPYGGGGAKQKSAVLRCRKAELLHEFFGTKIHSGADIRYFDRIFSSFLEKKWLIRYKRTVQEAPKTEARYYIIEDYLPLIKVLKFFPNLSEEEAKRVENESLEMRAPAGEYVLSLNPILTDQITSKYVEFPIDIDYRTRIAACSHLSVSTAIYRLRDWLISEMSAGRYRVEVNEETLIFRLDLVNYLKRRQKARIRSEIGKALQVSQHLGILLDVEETTGSMGQKKYIFKLNHKFH